jgi:hypothetical protein
LTERIRERKARLLEEIRQVLPRSGQERYVDLLGGAGDAGVEPVASLLRDVTEAEIVRDVGEVRDIVAAEQRLTAGRYGACVHRPRGARPRMLGEQPAQIRQRDPLAYQAHAFVNPRPKLRALGKLDHRDVRARHAQMLYEERKARLRHDAEAGDQHLPLVARHRA